jgi:hypothetical protein
MHELNPKSMQVRLSSIPNECLKCLYLGNECMHGDADHANLFILLRSTQQSRRICARSTSLAHISHLLNFKSSGLAGQRALDSVLGILKP